MSEVKKGLEDVTVLETRISSIDGFEGILEYRKINIRELYQLSYEAVSCFLLTGRASPTSMPGAGDFRAGTC